MEQLSLAKMEKTTRNPHLSGVVPMIKLGARLRTARSKGIAQLCTAGCEDGARLCKARPNLAHGYNHVFALHFAHTTVCTGHCTLCTLCIACGLNVLLICLPLNLWLLLIAFAFTKRRQYNWLGRNVVLCNCISVCFGFGHSKISHKQRSYQNQGLELSTNHSSLLRGMQPVTDKPKLQDIIVLDVQQGSPKKIGQFQCGPIVACNRMLRYSVLTLCRLKTNIMVAW